MKVSCEECLIYLFGSILDCQTPKKLNSKIWSVLQIGVHIGQSLKVVELVQSIVVTEALIIFPTGFTSQGF